MPKPLATQLYTFRDTTKPGIDGLGLDPAVLAAIAEIGFLGVETVDVPGGDPVAARRAIEAAGLQVASSHTWTKLDDLDAFDRASGAVAELGSSSIILSGSGFDSVEAVDAFADRLNAASAVADRHGLALGYHNHSAEMRPVDGVPVYRRLLERVDPAVAFQVDIFWVQVGGLAPGPVIAELGERVVSLHLKDGITLPSDAGAEPFVNVPVGQGIVDIAGAVEAAGDLPRIGWLIVEFDHCDGPPLEAVADSYAWLVSRGLGQGIGRVTAFKAARVGIVGCGNVTDLYLPACATLPAIELAACADLDPGRAAALSAKGGFPAMAVDALLADPDIEIVLNLTPPTAHVGVSRAAIAAGKHVYSEKPFATTRDDAAAILADGVAAGVVVGGAPDTFLGGGLQTARALIDEGAIGEPIGANAAVMHPGPERWHPNPDFFYGPGGGPLLDVGPYYIAALVSLLGPVAAVSAEARGAGAERRISSGTRAGDTFVAQVPTHAVAVYRFASGAIGGFTASFDVAASAMPHIEVHGTEGSLSIGDPNRFDGAVRLRRFGDDDWTDVPLRFDGSVGRGIGLADMIAAIREGRSPRASGALAFHALDVLLATETAAATHASVTIESTCERPAALDERAVLR